MRRKSLNGVGISGGFTGSETRRSQRNANPLTNRTTLSGQPMNSYHVVRASSVGRTAILDGFTVTGGKADRSYYADRGGGMQISDGSPTFVNVRFFSNYAESVGGGPDISSSDPVFIACSFQDNKSDSTGGAMHVESNTRLTLIDCSFKDNKCDWYGGAIAAYGPELSMERCSFTGNEGKHGGAVYALVDYLAMNRCVFDANSAYHAMGLPVQAADATGGALHLGNLVGMVANCLFQNNSATSDHKPRGGAIYAYGNLKVTNCTLIGNSVTDILPLDPYPPPLP